MTSAMKPNYEGELQRKGGETGAEFELVKVYLMWGSEKDHNYIYEKVKGTRQGRLMCNEKYALKNNISQINLNNKEEF